MIRWNRGREPIVPFSQRKEMLWAIRFVRICRLFSRILRSYTGDREKGCVFLLIVHPFLCRCHFAAYA